ncbi:SpoIIE family protein phosphatase [Kitasatospora sp. NA04385]|uniref:ATP-binding SpoIIE family protein phosphatase n=1 Tax=Kitasatospora sp. NA04385 TaxID=2742135 RepID=UPI001592701F|nr:SpoIIE family protein phosphatase [Kitasatospora sp. NA04385]QKW22081.1 SpoIIE family protein phosphatase [Kitasatospora sp. NA04385]
MTLEPLGAEPEVAAFTAFLGQLFQAMELSLTRYAARCNRDKGSVSRYLSGARIAPKDFVDELLRQVAETTGQSVSPDVQEHAHRLRMGALRVRNASRHEVEELRERLGAAERELQLAGVRERALLRSLEATEAQATQAEQRYRQLEADRATARYEAAPAELERWSETAETESAREELRSLKTELDLLRAELVRTRELRHDAEEQCLRLEARLLAAEAALAAQKARHEREFTYRGELESPGAVLTGEFGRKVGTTTDLETTAAELCEVFVPGWADEATVDVRAAFIDGDPPEGWTPDSGMLWRLGATAALGDRTVRGAVAVPRLLAERVLGEGRPVLETFPDRPAGSEPDSSAVALPLSVRGEVFGVLRLVRLNGRTPYGRADAELLSVLAERGALLLDVARMHMAEVRLARALQRSMIPDLVPDLPGVRLAHRFRPGRQRAGAGGDWFDAVPLRGNRVALVVGDVMGQGLHAAQAMSRLRAGVQAFTLLEVPPGQLLRHLDNLAQRLGSDHLATCVYAVYDPIERMCEIASAGHLPPVLLHHDGRSEEIALPTNAPIGVGGIPFTSRTIEVPKGSSMVLCTDNRVDLAAICREAVEPGWSPDRICAAVELRVADQRDDLAVLVAGFDGIPQAKVAHHTLAPRAREVSRIRRLVREQFTAWGLEAVADIAEVLVGELVTDAVAVAQGPVGLRVLWTDRLLVEVTDDHRELPVLETVDPFEEEGAGRGLLLVSRLADRWGTERRTDGRTVWFELRIRGT